MVVKNYGPLLGPYYNTAPNIWGTQKGTTILTTTHMGMDVPAGACCSCRCFAISDGLATTRLPRGPARDCPSLLKRHDVCGLLNHSICCWLFIFWGLLHLFHRELMDHDLGDEIKNPRTADLASPTWHKPFEHL